VFAAGAAAVIGAPASSVLDWQPGLNLAEPWRLWTAAAVHWSLPHLLLNLLATVLVGALGRTARVPGAAALAWALAWPLTHALLGPASAVAAASGTPGAAPAASAAALLAPASAAPLAHYGGLSGVLHAGVAVLALELALGPGRDRRDRVVGGLLGAGLLAKVLLESPWNLALRPDPLLGIAVAPVAHACGLVAGLAAVAVVAAGKVAVARCRAGASHDRA